MISRHTSRILNTFGLLAICLVLVVAFYDQFVGGNLPCPLCLLQRVGFVAVGFGLCLNLIYGSQPQHYGIMLLGALFGAAVSARQTLLHIVPGSGAYGDPFLGLHFYVWAFVCFCLVVLGTAVMLIVDRPTGPDHASLDPDRGGLAGAAVVLMLALTVTNAVATFLECGAWQCADDPTGYRLLQTGSDG